MAAILISREEFLHVAELAPLVSMDLVVRNSLGEVLLGFRRNRPAQNTWFVPGAVVRKGESRMEAYRRISEMELGRVLELANARLLGVYDHFYVDNAGSLPGFGTHYVVQAFQVELDLALSELPKSQHREYRWWPVSELLADDQVHSNTKAYFLN